MFTILSAYALGVITVLAFFWLTARPPVRVIRVPQPGNHCANFHGLLPRGQRCPHCDYLVRERCKR